MAESHDGVDAIAVLPVDDILLALRQTMVLGLPVEDDQKPTFVFAAEIEWAEHDTEGHPYVWTTPPSVEEITASVQPVCAYEFFSPLGRQGGFATEVGDFTPTTLVVTLFEDEWQTVRGFSYATVGPSDQRWFFRYWRPAYGLGGFTTYQIHCSAEGLE